MDFLRSFWPNGWAAPQWLLPGLAVGSVLIGLAVFSWMTSRASGKTKVLGLFTKIAAIAILVLILIEPTRHETRPEPGANLFLILADNSQSLAIRDAGEERTRGEILKESLDRKSAWQIHLAQDFDTRRYLFDRRVDPVPDFSELSSDGEGSSLASSLLVVARRYQGRPNAGLLLFTDGNATDLGEDFFETLPDDFPPVYPVVVGAENTKKDISVTRVSASQTNFEAAPVSVSAEIVARGYAGQTIVAQLLDEKDNMLEEQRVRDVAHDHPFSLEFQTRPETRGVHFYKVRAFAEGQSEQFASLAATEEATLANNTRHVSVDRAGGPYRVLYLAGRPNWEYKFLSRSIAEDDELELVALVRVAKREPKFTFRGRDDDSNPLFRGFGADREQAEEYDEPVLRRFGKFEEGELQGGFPKDSADLFRYHALILDDVEADFFTEDQKSLIQEFVSLRGGGFLMLGGQESFVKGEYDRTPIGELLPVYADRAVDLPPAEEYKLSLTRDGWIEPWVRSRQTEKEESRQLSQMTPFRTVNRVETIKPGARVLAEVQTADGMKHPALVVQPFGKGRSAALLIGDFWRRQMKRKDANDKDLSRSWRQMLRWLVAEVPQRVEVSLRRKQNEPNQPVEMLVTLRDEKFRPLDNASVTIKITPPGGNDITLPAEPTDKTGEYAAIYVPRQAGIYRAEISAKAADASEIGTREAGWVSEPETDEFRYLKPNRELLTRLAKKTDGEVIEAEELDAFVKSLPNRKVPITQQRINPIWHTWPVFLCALGLLVSEWGLRRWKGLP